MQSKVLQPIVYNLASTGQLQKPVLVMTITGRVITAECAAPVHDVACIGEVGLSMYTVCHTVGHKQHVLYARLQIGGFLHPCQDRIVLQRRYMRRYYLHGNTDI